MIISGILTLVFGFIGEFCLVAAAHYYHEGMENFTTNSLFVLGVLFISLTVFSVNLTYTYYKAMKNES
jgi:hypothetical protein